MYNDIIDANLQGRSDVTFDTSMIHNVKARQSKIGKLRILHYVYLYWGLRRARKVRL